MEIEIGAVYETRGGRMAIVTGRRTEGIYPTFDVVYNEPPNNVPGIITGEGRVAGAQEPDSRDLVERLEN